MSYGGKLKSFPKMIQKILPAAWITGLTGVALGITLGLAIEMLSGGRTSTPSVEASTTQNPVVAPAGTVLRVRLTDTLETGRSRPGDRFSGVLDAPLMVGEVDVLPKGTAVEGHVEAVQESGRPVLGMTLDSYESVGRRFAVRTNTVTRTAGHHVVGMTAVSNNERVLVAAASIIGFTLTCTLAI